MLQNLKLDDFLDYKESYVDFNEVIIYKKDLIKITTLMDLFISYNIYIEEEIPLRSFALNIQNEIGMIFIEYYNYTIIYQNNLYLNKDKLSKLLGDSLKIESILKLALKKTKNKNSEKNNIDILQLNEKNLNIIILNFFSKNYRNFSSINKIIPQTTTLYDVNLNKNKYYKITDIKEFVLQMFSVYIRTSKSEIPFTENFGSGIKEIVQRKFDSFTKQILFEEISIFMEELTNVYSEDVTLIDVIPTERETSSGIIKIKVEIIIQINNNELIKVELL